MLLELIVGHTYSDLCYWARCRCSLCCVTFVVGLIVVALSFA